MHALLRVPERYWSCKRTVSILVTFASSTRADTLFSGLALGLSVRRIQRSGKYIYAMELVSVFLASQKQHWLVIRIGPDQLTAQGSTRRPPCTNAGRQAAWRARPSGTHVQVQCTLCLHSLECCHRGLQHRPLRAKQPGLVQVDPPPQSFPHTAAWPYGTWRAPGGRCSRG